MWQDNVEVVRRVYENVPNIDPNDPLRALYAPDFELDQSDLALDVEDVAVGLDAANVAIREYWETFEAARRRQDGAPQRVRGSGRKRTFLSYHHELRPESVLAQEIARDSEKACAGADPHAVSS